MLARIVVAIPGDVAADLKAGATASLYNVCADPRLNHNPPVTHGVLAEQAGALLSAFFAKRRSD